MNLQLEAIIHSFIDAFHTVQKSTASKAVWFETVPTHDRNTLRSASGARVDRPCELDFVMLFCLSETETSVLSEIKEKGGLTAVAWAPPQVVR